jgi:hypothetical protein
LAPVWRSREHWIVKEFAASKGEGIAFVRSSLSLPPTDPWIVQVYIDRPLSINNKKFDGRLCVLVTLLAPIRIYLREFGLVRFATHLYDPETDDKVCPEWQTFHFSKHF